MKNTVDFPKLISDALEGDEKAFSELYQLTFKTAYHTASLFLKKAEDIEDALQNTYAKAFDKLSELKSPESFESWIKSIVENECKNFIKKERKFYFPLIFFKNKVDENAEEWKQPVPQDYMEREELRNSISEIIDSLSPEVRACIILFHYEDKSLNEIAEILDIPLGTVKSRLHNGRKQIEKEFNKLRKTDPTLLGIGAIPVILSLLSYQARNIIVPEIVSESVLSSAIASASAASTAPSVGAALSSSVAAGGATTAAGGVASSAATAIAVKVTAVAVAGAVVAGGSVAIKNYIQNDEPTTELTAVSSVYYSELHPSEELLSEIVSLTATSEGAEASATIAATEQTTNRELSTTAPALTTQKQTTTAAISTTQRETTTKAISTTSPPTTSPENNYSTSGGIITEYKGNDTNISMPSSIGTDTVTAIGTGAFAGNTKIKSVSVASSVTQIGQEAFADCTSLSSVSLPSSLELIGIGAFYGCSDLTSVSIPNGTKTISDEAFAQCSSLQTITIPSSVTSISDDAFDGCDSLIIRCEENSTAHDFAVANGIKFSLI